MGKIERFEDIKAWQKARILVNNLYNSNETGRFSRDFHLKDQVLRASFSVMLNIAEGFGRRTNKEFIHFLEISHASCSEIQSALYIAIDRKYISDSEFESLYSQCDEISKMTMGLIKYLK